MLTAAHGRSQANGLRLTRTQFQAPDQPHKFWSMLETPKVKAFTRFINFQLKVSY